MTHEFIKKVIDEGIVDTRNYRYVAKTAYTATEAYIQIKRLPIKDLDTTAAIDGWETVKEIRES